MLLAAIAAIAAPAIQGPTPNVVVVLPAPAVITGNFDLAEPPTCVGSTNPKCYETMVSVYYPDGKGPTSLGYANPPSPVFIQLRIGNGNLGPPTHLGWFQNFVLPKGFVGVDPNYPEVMPGEDYTVAEEAVARLIQYLRYYHEWFNIDPQRIFAFGRSFGGIMTLAVGLKHDYQDLSSPDPIHHESSRPNYLIPFSALSDITCLGQQVQYNDVLKLLFPVALAPNATTQQKLDDSAVWWLMHPEIYGRTYTPPMCLGYTDAPPQICGQIGDPHDSYFGLQLREKTDELADAVNDPQLGLASTLILKGSLWLYDEALIKAIDWAVAQLSPKVESLYLIPPAQPIGPTGSFQTLKVLGATPASPVAYFAGFHSGPVVLPSCSNITNGLPAPIFLGFRTPDAQGKATLVAYAPPQLIGLEILVHVVDLQTCQVSNLLHKQWLE